MSKSLVLIDITQQPKPTLFQRQTEGARPMHFNPDHDFRFQKAAQNGAGVVRLQFRDIEFLKDLNYFSVLSFSQVKRRHFADCGVSTTSERLTRLTRAGYIRRFTPGTILYHKRPEKIGVVFTLGDLGARVLTELLQSNYSNPRATWPNTYTLAHDILLTEVVTTLSEEMNPAALINGKELARQSQSKGQLVPDFVFEMANQNHKIAIELEMTMKSEQRYRDILTDYRCSKEFEKVIYVTPNVGIRDKCLKVLGQDQPPKNLRIVSAGKFDFRLLDDLIKDDEEVESPPIMTNNLNPSEKGSAA